MGAYESTMRKERDGFLAFLSMTCGLFKKAFSTRRPKDRAQSDIEAQKIQP